MNIIYYPLKDKKWIKTITHKTHVVWHGSFGRTNRTNGKATSTIDSWNNSDEKYGSPYLIDTDGTIYKTFDDREWIYHLRLPTAKGHYDKQSVAVTFATEQQLLKHNSQFFAFEYEQASNRYTGPIHEEKWRGFEYWAKLTEPQVNAAIELTLDICQRHGIIPVFDTGKEWNPEVWKKATVFTHAITKKEVTDLLLEPWVIEKIKAAGIPVAHS